MDIILNVNIATDRLSGVIVDDSVFVSRPDYRVYVSGFKMNYNNTGSALTIESNDGDPTSDSEWTFNIPDDGWFKFYYVAIGIAYDSGVTYDIYDAVYDILGNVYRSKVNSNLGYPLSDTARWELIDDPSVLADNKGQANESLNIDSLVYQRVLTPNSQYGYGNLIASGAGACCGDCDQSEVVQMYKLLSLLVNGAIECDYRTLLPQGEKICRKIQSLLSNC